MGFHLDAHQNGDCWPPLCVFCKYEEEEALAHATDQQSP